MMRKLSSGRSRTSSTKAAPDLCLARRLGAMAPQEVARIIQKVGRVLNAGRDGAELAWPRDHLAARSTRIGAAQDLAANGIDLTSIMHSGGWNDPKMPRY